VIWPRFRASRLVINCNSTIMRTCVFLESRISDCTIKFANSPPCACRGSTGQKPLYGLMTLTYQRFTAVLLLIYDSLFLSGTYYCLRVFWCAAARMSELQLREQRKNIKFLVKLGKGGNEIRDMLVQVYGDNATMKTAVL